jgi:hypothetical protein
MTSDGVFVLKFIVGSMNTAHQLSNVTNMQIHIVFIYRRMLSDSIHRVLTTNFHLGSTVVLIEVDMTCINFLQKK